MKNKLCFILTLTLLALIICSCSDNESWADNYITNMAEVDTDSKGLGITMRLDNGQSYTLTNAPRLERPDTTYRCVCLYTTDGTKATLTDYAKAFSTKPITDTSDLEIKTDPCQTQGVWVSGGYLNARLLMQGKDQTHIVKFIDRGITTNPNGSRTLSILLYHDQNGDMEAFTRTAYISCPIKEYGLQASRDSVEFIAPDKTYRLAY